MPSNYTAFDVKIDNGDGTTTPVPDATVNVFNATDVDELDPLTADSDGHVAGGSLAVDVGTIVYFRIENHLGLAGVLEQTTT